MQHQPTGAVNEVVADRLESATYPPATQYQLLHRRVQVQGNDHHCPPRSIGAKQARRECAASQVVFHHGMHLFAFATPPTQPPNDLLRWPIQSCHQSMQLVAQGYALLIVQPDGRKWQLLLSVVLEARQLQLSQFLPDDDEPVVGPVLAVTDTVGYVDHFSVLLSCLYLLTVRLLPYQRFPVPL